MIIYNSSNIEMKLGDHVIMKERSINHKGVIVYVPKGEDNYWESDHIKRIVILLDNNIYKAIHYTQEEPMSKSIIFEKRCENIDKVLNIPNIPPLFYFGTNHEVHLGDLIEYKFLFGFFKKKGTVSYLPGESIKNEYLEYDIIHQWVITLEDGSSRQMIYAPEETSNQAPKNISFVSRNGSDYRILPEEDFGEMSAD